MVGRLHAVGTAVWVNVTTVREAESAQRVGADALVGQGIEAGGHRASFDDTQPGDLGLLALLQLLAATEDGPPLIASDGLSTGRGVAAALAAGAVAAQVGTVFLRTPEAGTNPAHRDMLRQSDRPTALTRAFSGRTARGIRNGFQGEYTDYAPSAYPQVHHLTAPLRAAARAAGDPENFHLWAGQTYALAQPIPAAEVVHQLTTGAAVALREAQQGMMNFSTVKPDRRG